jgi:hypothetical protein
MKILSVDTSGYNREFVVNITEDEMERLMYRYTCKPSYDESRQMMRKLKANDSIDLVKGDRVVASISSILTNFVDTKDVLLRNIDLLTKLATQCTVLDITNGESDE